MIHYDDYEALLGAVHREVLARGVGQCRVEIHDDPMRRELGFRLVYGDGSDHRHMIRLSAAREAARKRPEVMTVEGRVAIAQSLEAGTLPAPVDPRTPSTVENP